MFALAFYGVDGIPGSADRRGIVWTQTGWQALTVVRWVVLATVLAAWAALVLQVSQRSHGSRTNTAPLVLGLGVLTTALLTYRVLIELPASNQVVDQKLGALLALGFAVGIAVGGWRSLVEQQASARRSRRRRLVSRRTAV
jgi:hypothetical protein